MNKNHINTLTFDQLSHLWKDAGFRSNTKYPAYLGALRVQFDDLTFEQESGVVTIGRCVVNFATNTIMDENQQEYKWIKRTVNV